jgi:serine/threonine protein kinase
VNEPPGASPLPKLIGPHRISCVLGEGQAAVVYLAEQRQPFQRTMALKLLKAKLHSTDAALRFEQELQTLALLQHPNIVQVFDYAARGRERPYFTMEYVEGFGITEFSDRHRLTVDARLGIFAQVCSAVQYIHQNGIVHRDLKPSNVLVRRGNGAPIAKLIDFGLIRLDAHRRGAAPEFDEDGRLYGTCGYLSPEQASGERVDTRTDVYALGALLYELLTGSTPIQPPDPDLGARGLQDHLVRVRREPPPLPSRRIAESESPQDLADLRATSVQALLRAMRRDLDWIVKKALETNPAERYQTVAALQADVRAYLRRDPVSVGPLSVSYAIRQGARRYRGVVLSALMTLVLLSSAVALSAYWHARLGAQHERELRHLRLAEAVQLEVANAHLWLEEGLAGDPSVDLDRDVTAPLQRCVDLVQAAARGGATDLGEFASSDSERLVPLLVGLERDLDAFSVICRSRWRGRGEGHVAGDASDRECDALHRSILSTAASLSVAVGEDRAEQSGSASWSVLLVNSVTVFLTLVLVLLVVRAWICARHRIVEPGGV